jgi:GNAT superfamily N-acetyltransferase
MTLAHIRAATRDGLDEAVELFARLDELEAGWRVFTARDHLAGDTRARYGRLIGSHEGLIVVAEAEGHLVGLGVAELTTPSSYSYDKAVVLSNLFVRPAYRRQGRAITAELMCFATRLGFPGSCSKGSRPTRPLPASGRVWAFNPGLPNSVPSCGRCASS